MRRVIIRWQGRCPHQKFADYALFHGNVTTAGGLNSLNRMGKAGELKRQFKERGIALPLGCLEVTELEEILSHGGVDVLPDDVFQLVIDACSEDFGDCDVPLLEAVKGLGCSKALRQQLHRLQPLVGVWSLAVMHELPAHGPWRVTLASGSSRGSVKIRKHCAGQDTAHTSYRTSSTRGCAMKTGCACPARSSRRSTRCSAASAPSPSRSRARGGGEAT